MPIDFLDHFLSIIEIFTTFPPENERKKAPSVESDFVLQITFEMGVVLRLRFTQHISYRRFTKCKYLFFGPFR